MEQLLALPFLTRDAKLINALMKLGDGEVGEWEHVRMMHLISALAGRGWHIPKNVTGKAERYV